MDLVPPNEDEQPQRNSAPDGPLPAPQPLPKFLYHGDSNISTKVRTRNLTKRFMPNPLWLLGPVESVLMRLTARSY